VGAVNEGDVKEAEYYKAYIFCMDSITTPIADSLIK